jgi:hypothetical protein
MKNCIHTSKLGLWVEFFGEFFCGHYYWYTSIEYRAIWKFKIFDWKFIKDMCFIHFFSNKKIILCIWRKNQYQMKEKIFIVGHCIIFSDFFCLVMFYESQTWGPMADKKLHIIYVVYIDFIQSSSSNLWIEINLDLKWNLSSKMLLCTF